MSTLNPEESEGDEQPGPPTATEGAPTEELAAQHAGDASTPQTTTEGAATEPQTTTEGAATEGISVVNVLPADLPMAADAPFPADLAVLESGQPLRIFVNRGGSIREVVVEIEIVSQDVHVIVRGATTVEKR